MPYLGLVGPYRQKCDEVAAAGFEGFEFTGSTASQRPTRKAPRHDRQPVLYARVPRRLRPEEHRAAGPGRRRLDPGLPARGGHLGPAERGQGQRHPDHHLVLGHAPDLAGRLRRPGARPEPGPVLHHRGQPDRQRPVHLAAQRRGANAGLAMSKFPRVRIGDDVVAQERLLRQHYGIERLALVAGGSMGAQQTYEWAVRFPDQVLRAAPIAGTAQNTPHCFLLAETMREATWSDPGWNGGEYAVERRRRGGPEAPGAHLGRGRLLHRVLEAGDVARAGVPDQGGVHHRLP